MGRLAVPFADTALERFYQKRQRVMQWCWGSSAPPSTGPDTITTATGADLIAAGKASGTIAGAASTQLWRINGVFPELYTYAHFHTPSSPATTPRVIVLHQGHDVMYQGALATCAEYFLARGYHVVNMAMPCWAPGNGVTGSPVSVALQSGAPVNVESHADLGTLHATGRDVRNPIRLYLDPVIRVINRLVDTLAFGRRVYLCGLSGGGWTTHMIAALDTRIRLSYPWAGFMPFDMPCWGVSAGDWEQTDGRTLYAVASVRELFAMGALEGRRVLQGLNNLDYAFWYDVTGDPGRPNQKAAVDGYVADVQALLGASGTFSLYVDTSTADMQHTISPTSCGVIHADILANDP